MPKSLSSILDQLSSKDIKQRLQGSIDIVAYLKSNGEIEYDTLGDVVDAVSAGIKDSNSKIAQGCLVAAQELLNAFGDEFKPHIHALLPTIIDKMGDVKASVSSEVQQFLQPAMKVLSPDLVFDKVLPLFKDKNWRAREQALHCLIATIRNYGISELPMPAILSNIIKVLEDPIQVVRDAAVLGVEEIYKEVGEPLRTRLAQHSLRPTLLALINDKLDAITPVNSAPIHHGTGTHSHNPPTRATTPSAPPTLSRSSSGSSVFSAGSGDLERTKSSSPKGVSKKLDRGKSPKPDRLGGSGTLEHKITPIRVNSEKELAHEFESINHTLTTQTDDWDKRVRALTRIQAIVQGGATEFPGFLPLLQRLRDPLALQVADLRSSVSKEACNTITLLSSTLGDAFEPLADTLIDVLLKCTIVTIQVISDSANKCIRSIIKQTRINRAIPKLCDGAGNKSGIIRSRCMEYILLLLGVAPTAQLEKYVDQIEAAIRNGVADAVGETRSAARSAFIVFCGHWETRGTRLLPALEEKTRRLIHEEMLRGEQGELGSTSGSMNSTLSSTREMSSSGERPGSSKKPRAPVRANSAERLTTPNSAPLPRANPPSLASQQPQRKLPERNLENTTSATTPTNLTRHPHNTENGRPSSVTKRTATTPTPTSHAPHSSHTPQPLHTSQPLHSSQPLHNSQPIHTSQPLHSSQPLHNSQPLHASRAQDDDEGSHSLVSIPSNLLPEFREFVVLDINKLFTDAESSLWSSRADAFLSFQKLIVASTHPRFPPTFFTPHNQKVTKLILERMGDPHAKVVKNVLDCLLALATHHHGLLVPYLDRILPPMFVRLSGNKEDQRAQASAILAALLVPLRGPTLLSSVLRVLDVLPPKPRGAALEYMLHLLAPSQEHLTYPPHMRVCVHKVLVAIGVVNVSGTTGGVTGPGMSLSLADPSQVGQIPPDARRAGLQCLVELYSQYRPQFIAQLLPMPVTVQYEVKKLLASCHVNVDADLASAPGKPFTVSQQPPMMNGKRPPSRNSDVEMERPSSRSSDASDDSYKETKSNPIPNFNTLSINNTTTSTKSTPATTTPKNPGRPNSSLAKRAASPAPPSQPVQPQPQPTPAQPTPPLVQFVQPPQSAQPPAFELTPASLSVPNGSTSASAKKDDKQNPLSTKRKSPLSTPTPQTPTKGTKPQPEIANALAHIANAGDDETRRDGLHRLVKLVREDPDLVRSAWFEQMLISVLDCLRDETASMKELGLVVLAEMVKATMPAQNQHGPAAPFEPFINITFARVMEVFRDRENAQVKQAAEDAMEYLLSVMDPLKCSTVLVALVQGEDGPVLQACVKYLAKCAAALSPTVLRHQLANMLPGLFEAFKNANADVRKAVVFCLVDLYMVLGDELVPFLSSLTTSQKKLVTIYINRAKSKPAGAGGAAPSDEGMG